MANTPYIEYDPQTSAFTTPALLPANAHFDSRAIAVDHSGNIVSGELFTPGRIIKTKPGGAIVWDTNTLPAGPAVPAADLHGMIIDDNDDVWAVHYHENRVVKYSGLDGHFIKTVAVGEQPYTYGNAPPPVCTPTPSPAGDATFNKDKSDCAKGNICFDYKLPKLPNGTTGTVNLSLELYQNGVVLNTLTSGPLTTSGTYCFTNFLLGLNASVGGFDWKMTANYTVTGTTIAPVVVGKTGEGFLPGNNNDCTLPPVPGCAQITGEARCLPAGGYSYTLTATNTGSDMSQILFTPLPGSTFTLSQALFNLPSPLHNGQSATVTVNIGNVKQGDKICFFVSLMSEKAACCTVQVCPELPKCDASSYPASSPPAPSVKRP